MKANNFFFIMALSIFFTFNCFYSMHLKPYSGEKVILSVAPCHVGPDSGVPGSMSESSSSTSRTSKKSSRIIEGRSIHPSQAKSIDSHKYPPADTTSYGELCIKRLYHSAVVAQLKKNCHPKQFNELARIKSNLDATLRKLNDDRYSVAPGHVAPDEEEPGSTSDSSSSSSRVSRICDSFTKPAHVITSSRIIEERSIHSSQTASSATDAPTNEETIKNLYLSALVEQLNKDCCPERFNELAIIKSGLDVTLQRLNLDRYEAALEEPGNK